MTDETRRRIVRTGEAELGPYDMEGPVQPDMAALYLSYDKATAEGCYLMRMDPGAVTIPHDHAGFEDFLVLDGALVDSDGTVFRAGDAVSYAPGTHHNSWTTTGCTLIGFDWRPRPPSPRGGGCRPPPRG
ncbi:MAG: cupin domain-containing protein [Alphaproteobacteria bacterium]